MSADDYFEHSEHFYLVCTDLQGRFTYTNALFRQRFGYLADDLTGLPFHVSVCDEEDAENLAQAALRLIGNTALRPYVEVRKRLPGNVVVWQAYEMSPICDVTGQLTGIRCVGYDITRSKAEQARAEQAVGLVNDLVVNMQDGMLLVDSNQKILLASPFAEKMLNATGQKLQERHLSELTDDVLVAEVCRQLQEPRDRKHAPFFEVYHPVRKVWLHVRLFVHRSGTGVYFKNVTTRKRHEARLVKSQARLRAILDSQLDEVHYLLDPKLKVVLFNRAAGEAVRNIHGREPKEGDDFRLYILPGTEKSFAERFARALAGERSISEAEVPVSTERRVWYRIEFRPVADAQGKVTAVAFNAQNIDERKRATARLEEQNKQLRSIAFTQSHTLRRPVSSILGLLNLINEYGNDRTFADELLRHLRLATEELDTVIRGIVAQTDAALGSNADLDNV
ncbi:MAG: PAS domain S-box protein [Cytophagales bacterium]|nr:PAS domain S-box protein [Cytophagales bacterium]